MAPALSLEDRTLPGIWRTAVEAAPDRLFLRWADGALSYGAMDEAVNAVARGLAHHGLARHGKIALMLNNSAEFVAAWFAATKLGAIYVPINTEYKGDILRHVLRLAQVTHLVIDADYLDRVAAIEAEVPRLAALIVVAREVPSDPSRFARLTTVDWEDLAATPGGDPSVRVEYTDPFAISFTSGTTGPSKGVLASHCHALTFALDWIETCHFTFDDRLYSPLPMFHAIATWLGIVPTVIQRTTSSFAERFSASRFWDDVRRFDATAVHGIFAMIPMLLKQPPRPDDADVPARVFYIGQRNAAFEARFQCRIVEAYGATETGIVTSTPLDEPQRPGSCGRPNARTYDVALLDERDNPVPVGTPGEIAVRPRQPHSMFQGYYGMPAETVAAWSNLWFHTGDTARADEDGYLYFVDRKKDAIRRRGENISSFELEGVLAADPRVAECAAVAHPSELGEDEVKMVIVAADGQALAPADVWTICDERMPRFWVPRFLEFRDHLPKTPNGKVRKLELRGVHAAHRLHDREARA